MHPVIQDGLEDYLSGTMDPRSQMQFDAHLAVCAPCREQVEGMREISSLFAVLRTESRDAPAPAAGFYARVSQRIDLDSSGSIWTALLQPAFARRIAFASLLLLATLGGFLVSVDPGDEFASSPTPEMILAADDETPAPFVDPFDTRDRMLVTLVSHK